MLISDLPRPFSTIVSRDQWMWEHTDAPLLQDAEQDRLLELFDDIENPTEERCATYAAQIASVLEGEQRWAEAQSYWYASMHCLSRANLKMSSQYDDTLAGVIRTGARSAGMHVPDSSMAWRELMADIVQMLSVPIRSDAVRSLLLIGSEDHHIYEDLELAGSARRALAQTVAEAFSDSRSESFGAKQRQSHEVFSRAVENYTQALGQISHLIETVRANPTLDNLLDHREKLIVQVQQLTRLALRYDRPILENTHTLMSAKLTAYRKFADQRGPDVFEEVIEAVHALLEEIRDVGSHLGTCIFAPLAMLIESIVNEHYEGILHATSAALRVQLLKPEARRTESDTYLDIEVVNEGTDAAEDCELLFTEAANAQWSVDNYSIWFGRIARGQSKVERCTLHGSLATSILELEYSLEWRDRGGAHARADHLKVNLQRELDWSLYEKIPAPYIEKSISDPARLQGREDALRTLRFGFQAKGSFMVTGQRRVGKTSLVKVFLAELRSQPGVLSLYVPIGELSAAEGAQDVGRLGRDLAERVSEEFELRFGVPVGIAIPGIDEFRDAFNASFSRFVRQFTRAHNLRLAFALDDFDELPTQLFTGSSGRAFFLALRALIDQGTTFFFIGSERLPAIMDEQAQRLNQVRTLAVDYLDRPALEALVREPVQGLLSFQGDALDEIEIWSARNPYFATLICNTVWERAVLTRDYWVTRRDVELAIRRLAETSKRNSYQHFWSDSPHARDEDRTSYESKSSYIVLALTQYQSEPLAYTDRRLVTAHAEGLTTQEAEQHLQQMIDHTVVEAHKDKPELVRIRVPLFMQWLKLRGATELREALVSRGNYSLYVSRRHELTPEEVLSVADGLTYRGEKITTDQIRQWAEQFGAVDDQRLMLKLLRGVARNLYTLSKFNTALTELHEQARHVVARHGFATQLEARDKFANWYVTHVDPTGKSGSSIVTKYRSVNRIQTVRCGSPEKVLPAVARNTRAQSIIVCVDDFVGTGRAASTDLKAKFLPRLEKTIPSWRERVLVIFAAVAGFEDGLVAIEEAAGPNVNVVSRERLTNADKAFSEDNDLFESFDERRRARELASKIGSVLERRHPLGWEESQALVVFPENVPNNTLPILYKDGVEYDGKPWHALFPRS